MPTDVIVEHLGRRFGAKVALRDVSFNLSSGTVLGVLGPSGCGKSTLLRLVAGLDKPDQGRILMGNQVVADAQGFVPPERRSINMVFQDYALWPHMRVRNIVGYGLPHLTRQERDQRVKRLLEMLQIGDLIDRFPAQLSGGQQQRVAIARALATEPELLLFDEPLSNLDVQLRQEMRVELSELLGQVGTTALYVTHDPEEASAVSTHLLVLRDGNVEEYGPPAELFRHPNSAWMAILAGYTNQLSGVVTQVLEPGLCLVQVGSQLLKVTVRGRMAVQPGSPLRVYLNSSLMRIAVNGQASSGCNHLWATVQTQALEGRQWRLRLAVEQEHVGLWTQQSVAVGSHIGVEVPITETLGFG
ncbi:MAG: ABC transporter ATP-binding protein [Cyanophyceae cyanobacterium]|jgi:ABC-type Fe3+/spermidine/putrescine transport system ATPase subunit